MEDFLADFRLTIESAFVRLKRMTEEQSVIPTAEGKWSAREIIGHLIDSAANNHQRFVRAQFTDDLVFPGYDQEKWVTVQAYNEEPWENLVQLWRLYNLHLVHMIARIPAPTLTLLRTKHSLDRIALETISSDREVTLEYLVRDYLRHLKHHLKQIGI
ncbi:MAG TPA: DinB family protein [Pyrinomonadaceae bacterium]|nr:DinB family protein [Pyrinomonadaceae bacterium]